MERNQTKSLEQYQHELLNKTHELHAMLEAIQHLTTNDAVQVSAACLTTLAIMGQRKVEQFWETFEGFSRQLLVLKQQAEGVRL